MFVVHKNIKRESVGQPRTKMQKKSYARFCWMKIKGVRKGKGPILWMIQQWKHLIKAISNVNSFFMYCNRGDHRDFAHKFTKKSLVTAGRRMITKELFSSCYLFQTEWILSCRLNLFLEISHDCQHLKSGRFSLWYAWLTGRFLRLIKDK